MLQSASDFIRYFESIRRRTLNYVRVLPAERLDWAPKEGEFTCADILRHIAASEKMFVRVVTEGRWHYGGHAAQEGQSLDDLIALLERTHAEAMETLGQLPDHALNTPRNGPGGQPLKAWRWLMVMAEHEIHHRSQLAVYLSLMGVQPPHIFGLGVEDLIAISVA
jgi:uncharacterized damage-inducible protein DinB